MRHINSQVCVHMCIFCVGGCWRVAFLSKGIIFSFSGRLASEREGRKDGGQDMGGRERRGRDCLRVALYCIWRLVFHIITRVHDEWHASKSNGGQCESRHA